MFRFSGVLGTQFWSRHYFLGGNDLAASSVPLVLDRAKNFIREAKLHCQIVRVCTVEQCVYQVVNQFGVNFQEFKLHKNHYNHILNWYLSSQGLSHIDLGKPVFSANLTVDGVHFRKEAKQELIRVFRSNFRSILC